MKRNLLFQLLGLGVCLGLSAIPATAQDHDCAKGHVATSMRKAAASVSHNQLMNRYDVTYYKLDVALERTTTYISGNAQIMAKSKVAALDTFAFELHQNLQIDSVIINNQKVQVSRNNGEVIAPVAAPVALGGTVSAQIFYKGLPPSGASAAIGNGMSNDVSPTWGNRITWSLSQPFAAYEWFPCKQILTDKADSVAVFVTTDISNKVGSNGLLQQVVPLPNNKHRYEWKSRYPIAYYLISVAVGEYVEYNIFANPAGATQPVLIQNYIYNNPQTLSTFQSEINQTVPMLENFSSLFGLYPFYQEKYGHSMAPISGGMEHQTMTTQGFFDFTLTAHELGHQWFGDNVTCASWRDIWLNEGFASYLEYVALENIRPGQEVTWMANTHNIVLSQPGGSVIIPASDTMNVSRIFNSRLTYKKGAAVVHMLRYEVNNDSLFFATLRQYQQQFKDSTATTQDLQNVFEQATGRSFQNFFQQWVYGQGYPTFQLRWNQQGNQLVLRSQQTASTGVTPLFRTHFDVLMRTSAGDSLVRLYQDQPVQLYSFPVSGTVSTLQFDPQNWLLNVTNGIIRDNSLVGVKKELAKTKVVAYPVPAKELLYFSGLTFAPEVAEVTDLTGRVVAQLQHSADGAAVRLPALASGRYIIHLRDDQHLAVVPIVIQ